MLSIQTTTLHTAEEHGGQSAALIDPPPRSPLSPARCSPHVANVGEEKEEPGLSPGLMLIRRTRLADAIDQRVHDLIQHMLDRRTIMEALDRAGEVREDAWRVTARGQL